MPSTSRYRNTNALSAWLSGDDDTRRSLEHGEERLHVRRADVARMLQANAQGDPVHMGILGPNAIVLVAILLPHPAQLFP